ncbi:iron donor protein CyaY [Dongia sedimenti]|uniref:Iron donor protein CyaY n=1 Tax=Dongia sedimenti TaxID=3064282 RepID=A0ABU0YHD1_9PROT|nr:iron donor protein CyaY [Rhodospirillaceae bacterium R-7]
MDEPDFERQAAKVLDRLMAQIEDQAMDELDVDLEGGILTIGLPGGGQYLINKHAPNREIWLSSPKSGAWHFRHDPEAGWVSTRVVDDARPQLHRLLSDELAAVTGTPVELVE